VTATYETLEALAEARSTTSVVVETSMHFLAQSSRVIAIMMILCAQVAHNDVLRAGKGTLLPLGVIHIAAGSVQPILKSYGAFEVVYWARTAVYASVFFGMLLLLIQIGRRINDGSFWWKLMAWFSINYVLTAVSYELVWRAVPDWTDLQKAIFVMVYAPFVTEVALTIGRFVTRGIPERHEAASWVLNGCM
jgi:hypothetical protein